MRFERVGSEKPVTVDVRIITATNKDINLEVREGRFREDLFFRLNVIPLLLPPLRERKGDIALLVEYFLERYDIQNQGEKRIFSDEALDIIQNSYWAGNIRELKNFIQRVAVMTDEKIITEDMVRYYLEDSPVISDKKRNIEDQFSSMSLSRSKRKF